MERLRLILPVLLLVVLQSCNVTGEQCYEFPLNSTHVGVFADTSGRLQSYFPLDTDDLANGFLTGARILPMKREGWISATSNKGTAIIDLKNQEIIFAIQDYVHTYFAGPTSNKLYYLDHHNGYFQFADSIKVFARPVETQVKELTVSPRGDTTSQKLFSFRIRKTGKNRFETNKIVAVYQITASSYLYIKDREIKTVQTDITGDNVHVNRFFYGRSLWRFDRANHSHTLVMELPDPAPDPSIASTDISTDGRYLSYIERGNLYFVDIQKKSSQRLSENYFGSWYKQTVLSHDGKFVIASYGNTYYNVFEPSTGSYWQVLKISDYISGIPTFSPTNQFLYYSDFRNDTMGIWKVGINNHFDPDKGSMGDFMMSMDEEFGVPKDRRFRNDLGQPYLLDSDKLFYIGYYGGADYGCY